MSDATMTRTGPSVRRGKSKQDYGTPWEFISAVERRFEPLVVDLACTRENSKAPNGLCYPDQDAFAVDWSELGGGLWCNPPFADIEPWAEKMANECEHRESFAFLLVPASIGTDWFAKHVAGRAYVLGLSPRLTFEGCEDPYPKDLMLAVYGFGLHGFDTWRWTMHYGPRTTKARGDE